MVPFAEFHCISFYVRLGCYDMIRYECLLANKIKLYNTVFHDDHDDDDKMGG